MEREAKDHNQRKGYYDRRSEQVNIFQEDKGSREGTTTAKPAL